MTVYTVIHNGIAIRKKDYYYVIIVPEMCKIPFKKCVRGHNMMKCGISCISSNYVIIEPEMCKIPIKNVFGGVIYDEMSNFVYFVELRHYCARNV